MAPGCLRSAAVIAAAGLTGGRIAQAAACADHAAGGWHSR
jgi:hypothetical protein